MKRILLILLVLASVSCKKVMEPVRIQIPNTYWSYSVNDQTARVCFPDKKHASVLQLDQGANAFQALHGTYYTDGHRLVLSGENWPKDILFVRTFTHLKNSSTNKDMTPVYSVAHDAIAGSVWTTMVSGNLNIVFFDHDGTCLDASFKNVAHKEGIKYGWDFARKDYTLNGKKLQVGGIAATMFEDFMQVDTIAVMQTAPAVESSGSSALAGTVWTCETSGYPGLIFFTSEGTFTRVLAGSDIVYSFLNGTYQVSGTSLTMTDGKDINETCQLSADRFTFLERTYVKVTLP
ncbi:MAG: hypothetical protein IKR38_03760 [Bacteroidales bacterium]|nr:hypothetical protein [Bacteroidales bacterium]